MECFLYQNYIQVIQLLVYILVPVQLLSLQVYLDFHYKQIQIHSMDNKENKLVQNKAHK